MTKEKEVFVVTRNGRRIEDVNYETRQLAKERMDSLAAVLKKWRDPDLRRLSIVKTSEPKRVR